MRKSSIIQTLTVQYGHARKIAVFVDEVQRGAGVSGSTHQHLLPIPLFLAIFLKNRCYPTPFMVKQVSEIDGRCNRAIYCFLENWRTG